MNPQQTIGVSDAKEMMHLDLNFLRDYATKLLLEEDSSITTLEETKELYRLDFFKLGSMFGLTERDLMVLLFKGILNQTVRFDA